MIKVDAAAVLIESVGQHACPVADQGHELKADRTVESCDPLPTNYGHVA